MNNNIIPDISIKGDDLENLKYQDFSETVLFYITQTTGLPIKYIKLKFKEQAKHGT